MSRKKITKKQAYAGFQCFLKYLDERTPTEITSGNGKVATQTIKTLTVSLTSCLPGFAMETKEWEALLVAIKVLLVVFPKQNTAVPAGLMQFLKTPTAITRQNKYEPARRPQ